MQFPWKTVEISSKHKEDATLLSATFLFRKTGKLVSPVLENKENTKEMNELLALGMSEALFEVQTCTGLSDKAQIARLRA